MEQSKQQQHGGWFSVLLVTALGFAVCIIVAILAAQTSYSGVRAPLSQLAEPRVFRAVILSFATATPAAVAALVLAIPCAYALARLDFTGKRIVDALLDVPVVLSPVALGFSLVLLFQTSGGQWFQEHVVRVVYAVPGIMIAQFILALALCIRVLKASFEEVPVRLEQVARFLGCTPWQAFMRVSLPLARPGILAAFVLGWARAMGDFGATVTIAGAIPGKTETMPIAIDLNMSSMQLDRAVALMLLLTVLALVVLVLSRVVLGSRRVGGNGHGAADASRGGDSGE
ncbi:MAG: ABC transporter permease [Planctomycetes bacterium]|nr:ABC transporter permease [Planctomycetota bacterium]